MLVTEVKLNPDIQWLLQHKRKTSLKTKLYMFFVDSESSFAASIYAWVNIIFLMLTVSWGVVLTTPGWDNDLDSWAIFEYITCSLIFVDTLARFLLTKSFRGLLSDPSIVIGYLNVIPCIIFFTGGYNGSNTWLFFVWLLRLPLRLLMVARDMQYLSLVIAAVTNSIEPLLLPLFMLIAYVTCFACLFYFVEHDDESFYIYSIPQCMYFAMVTIASVGYGDIYPLTWWGRVTCVYFMVTGIMYTAIPLSIVGNNFAKLWLDRERLSIIKVAKRRILDMGVTAEEMINLFEIFDKDKSGDIGVPEFKSFIAALNLGLNEYDTVKLFRAFDTDKTGNITFNEFYSAMKTAQMSTDEESMPALARRTSLKAPEVKPLGVTASQVRKETDDLINSLLAPLEARILKLAQLMYSRL